MRTLIRQGTYILKDNKDNKKKHGMKAIFHHITQRIFPPPQTKSALIQLLRDTQQRSLISVETLSMLEGVLQLAQMQVRDIMLPKNQMICISSSTVLDEIMVKIIQSGHSRFPVIADNSQEIVGILHSKDLLRFQVGSSPSFHLNDIVRQPTFIPESTRLDLLLREFRNTRNHMAIVVDEYGTTSGFVTIEDIIEQITGDIEDEFDIDEENYIKAHGDAYYIVNAQIPIEEFNEQLDVDWSHHVHDTIGGAVLARFGYLPSRGETITIEPFDVTVINADARRIKLVSCFDKRPNARHPNIATDESDKKSRG